MCERFDAAISRFHDRHPKVEILIDITTWDSVAAALLRDEIDIGVASAQTLRSDLVYDFLFDEVHGVYCGQPIRFMARPSTTLPRSRAKPSCSPAPTSRTSSPPIATRHGLGLEVAGLSEHLDEAKRLTILGVGICFLPEAFAAPDVEAGRLWPLLRHADQPCMPVFVITNPRAPGKLARQLLLAEIGVPGGAN